MRLNKYALLFLMAISAGAAGMCGLVSAQAQQQRAVILAQIAAKEAAIAQMREATAGMDDVQAKVAEVSRAVTQVESRLAPEHGLDQIVKDIWQMAESDSLHTQAIQPLNIVHRGNCAEQPVELKLTGDFRGFYAFMLQLEKMPRLVRVTHMELQRLPDQNGAMLARVTIAIFYQPETGETAAATSP
jgi:type IV pilus assembly protein PilO